MLDYDIFLMYASHVITFSRLEDRNSILNLQKKKKITIFSKLTKLSIKLVLLPSWINVKSRLIIKRNRIIFDL